MRPSRIFRLVIRILLMVLSLSMSLVSFLGGYSAIIILSDADNLAVPDGEIEFNLDLNETEEMYLKFPYKINNVGYFDLEDLTIEFEIYLKYEDKTDDNDTKKIKIVDAKETFDIIKANEKDKGEFKIEADEFKNMDELEDLALIINLDHEPNVWYTANIKISAYYSLRLLYFSVDLENIDIGEQLNITEAL